MAIPHSHRESLEPTNTSLPKLLENNLAYPFKNIISHFLNDKILSPGYSIFYEPVEMYITDRKNSISGSTEELLDLMFWNKEQYPSAFIFLLGVIGSGKSTMVEYYFRRLCPIDYHHIEKHHQKMVINVDCLWGASVSDFKVHFFSQIKSAIQRFIREFNNTRHITKTFDIQTSDAFMMWDPEFDWDSALYKGISEIERNRLITTKLAAINSEQWVDLALNYLSKLMAQKNGSTLFPAKYFILTLDNLDQSPLEVIEYAIKQIDIWLRKGYQFWRVIVPLWPTTYAILRKEIDPFPQNPAELEIGELNSKKLFSIRSELIVKEVHKRIHQMIHDESLKSFDSEALKGYNLGFMLSAKSWFIEFVKRLSGHSLSRELRIWEATWISRNLEEHYLVAIENHALALRNAELDAENRTPFSYIGNYAWATSMLCGKYSYHHRVASLFPNFFYTLESNQTHFAILLGFHILCLIKGGARSYTTIVLDLLPLGYKAKDILEALNYLSKFHLIKPFNDNSPDDFDVYDEMPEVYYDLIQQEFYVDSMALTTPVESIRIQGMRSTKSYLSSQFTARAKTTSLFIEQIMHDEEKFCTWKLSRSEATYGEFSAHLTELNIPRLSKLIGANYFKRLGILRNPRNGQRAKYLKDVTEKEWEDLCDCPLVYTINNQSDYLLALR